MPLIIPHSPGGGNSPRPGTAGGSSSAASVRRPPTVTRPLRTAERTAGDAADALGESRPGSRAATAESASAAG